MPATSDKLAQAASRYRAGRSREAAALLREVLATDPGSADALFLLGSIAAEAGKLAESESLLRRALARRALEPAFHAALGNTLSRAGRDAEALACYRSALQLAPQLLDLHLNIGHALRALGRDADALAAYDRLLAARPAHGPALLGRAWALVRLRRAGEARAALAQARSALPPSIELELEEAGLLLAAGEAEAAFGRLRESVARLPEASAPRLALAAALARAGDRAAAVRELRLLERRRLDPQGAWQAAELYMACEEPGLALPHLDRLLRFDPRLEIRVRRAAALLALRRPDGAVEELRRAASERPGDAGIRSDLGLALLGANRPGEAVVELEEALRLRPEHWQALHNLALVRLRMAELPGALEALELARRAQPRDPGVLADLGYLRCIARDFERGEALLREAGEAFPGHRKSRRYLALYLLGRGRFEEGWDAWIAGSPEEKAVGARALAVPWWRGEAEGGESLAVWSEQGIGDQIMFCNPVPDLVARGARVVLECTPRLERLFARSFPGAQIVPRAPGSPARIAAAGVDRQTIMSRLPQYLRRSWEAFPRHEGYLRAAPERVAHWRARLDALGPGPKVGLSWAGGTARTGKARRSSTLADWLPLLRTPGVRFVSLQYTDCRADLARLRDETGIEIAHWQEAIDDYDETAALATALDAVASVCTSIIHLAGALGRPTFVAVPWWPSWRYLLEGDRMPWYPSVRLVRQGAPGDWEAPLRRIASLVAEAHFDQ